MQVEATLAMPKTEEENRFLKEQLNFNNSDISHPDVYLGGSDIESEGEWKWLDGTLITLSQQALNWGPYQPNNWGGNQDCLKLYFRGSKRNRESGLDGKFWDDGTCENKQQYVCSLDLNFGCPLGWLKHQGNCYYVSEALSTWKAARDSCSNMQNKSDLVEFSNEQEAIFVKELAPGEQVWVGASDLQNIGIWEWNSGANFKIDWDQNEPNLIGIERCAVQLTSGKINNVKCDALFKYVCKMESSLDNSRDSLSLSDHLHQVEKNIRSLKSNVTNNAEKLQAVENNLAANNITVE